jgi:hypothetical protein
MPWCLVGGFFFSRDESSRWLLELVGSGRGRRRGGRARQRRGRVRGGVHGLEQPDRHPRGQLRGRQPRIPEDLLDRPDYQPRPRWS